MESNIETILQQMMHDHAPIVIGQSNFQESLGYPLPLSYLVILICHKGSALININMQTYTVKIHDVLVLSDDSFALVLKKSRQFEVTYCLIDRSLAADIAFQLPHQLFSFLNDVPSLRLDQDHHVWLSLWLKQCNLINQEAHAYRMLMLKNHLQNFFLKITAHMPTALQRKAQQFSRQEQLCWRFWKLLQHQSKQHRSVSYYAGQLAITPFYLSQICKAVFNDSPKDLIYRQVILEIKVLLSTTNNSIESIASEMNFVDPSYLNRFFKRQTGLSLSQYRKQQGI